MIAVTVKKLIVVVALILVLGAGPASAQTAPPQTPPPQNPPAQTQPPAQPPAGTKPAETPAPAPKPFPEGAKVAYVFMQAVFNNSAEGKAATAKLQEWEKKKVGEIQEKTKQVQALQTKLQQGGTVLNDQARSSAEKELQKQQRELQNMQEDAQAEGQELRQKLLDEFSQKVNPIIETLAKERGLHMVFSVSAEANIAWADPGLDLSAEIVKRVDAARGTPKK
jgi:Skp family chaperone for outer membrane proteins